MFLKFGLKFAPNFGNVFLPLLYCFLPLLFCSCSPQFWREEQDREIGTNDNIGLIFGAIVGPVFGSSFGFMLSHFLTYMFPMCFLLVSYFPNRACFPTVGILS